MPINVEIPSIEELTQNVARLLQQSLAAAAQAANPVALSTADLELSRSAVKALAFVHAVGLHGAYRYLRDFVARQAIPINASDEHLDDWMGTYGMARRDATATAGQVHGTGVNATLLLAGTLLQTTDGRQYRVEVDVAVQEGVVEANLVAIQPGAAYNLAEGTELRLVSPVVGIDSVFTAPDGLAGGAETEDDANAFYRLQQRLANEPMGGSPADYARWALSVPGITRAWGVRNPAGPTSAGVIIMADGNGGDGIPSLAQRDLVLDYIRDPKRGPPDELFVILPVAAKIDWIIHLAPDTAANRAGIIAALQELFFREAVPGGSIPHSHATEVISAVAGEYNHTISSPHIISGDFFTVPRYDHLLMLGTVSFD